MHDTPSVLSSRCLGRNGCQADYEKFTITLNQKTISQISCGWGLSSFYSSIAYLKSLLNLSSETHSRQTRYANFNVACSIVKRQKEGGRTFTVTTCKLWNSLPLTTRKLATISSCKKSLWKNIFNNQQVLNHFSLEFFL